MASREGEKVLSDLWLPCGKVQVYRCKAAFRGTEELGCHGCLLKAR